MAGDLLEHVVEEADAGGDGDRRLLIEVHRHRDVRLLRPALDAGHAIRAVQARRDLRPGQRVIALQPDPFDAEALRKVDVGPGAADHAAARAVERRRGEPLGHRRQLEVDGLGGKQPLKEIGCVAGPHTGADPHEAIAGLLQFEQRGNDAGLQAQALAVRGRSGCGGLDQ